VGESNVQKGCLTANNSPRKLELSVVLNIVQKGEPFETITKRLIALLYAFHSKKK